MIAVLFGDRIYCAWKMSDLSSLDFNVAHLHWFNDSVIRTVQLSMSMLYKRWTKYLQQYVSLRFVYSVFYAIMTWFRCQTVWQSCQRAIQIEWELVDHSTWHFTSAFVTRLKLLKESPIKRDLNPSEEKLEVGSESTTWADSIRMDLDSRLNHFRPFFSRAVHSFSPSLPKLS